jgi:hypothetical protein
MSPRSLRINEKESTITIRTRATGMLARLAHNLEIVSNDVRGSASSDGDAWTAEILVPIASLRVVGARKGDRVDPNILSSDDRAEIERKIRAEVFGGAGDVSARAEGTSLLRGEASISIGGAYRGRARVMQTHTEQEPDAEGGPRAISVSGRADVSLRALGIPEVRGPLNAFRVSDTVEVLYNLTMTIE